MSGDASTPRARWRRWLPLAMVGLCLTAVIATGLHGRLSLEELRARRVELTGAVHAHPALSALAYMGLYLLVVALSLPGALIMTLSGGLLFGPVWGTAAAVAGASAGAVVMFLVARSALGGALRRRAERSGGLVLRLERAISANAFVALLSARLTPALPIWLVNVAAALVEMPVSTYVAATVLGIIPSTALYAGVGAGLGRVFEAGGPITLATLVKPGAALALLGLAVLAAAPIAWRTWRARAGRASDPALMTPPP